MSKRALSPGPLTPNKRQKNLQYDTKYSIDFEKKYDWVRKSDCSATQAFCTVCQRHFSVSHGGIDDYYNFADVKFVTMADEEKPEYFYRLVSLVIDLGTEGLWKVLLKEIHGQTIQSFLAEKGKEIKKLKKKNVLNEMQCRILQAGNESEFDISLLYVLIRNLTDLQPPLAGWDVQCPIQSDRTPGANIVRLKMVRNEATAHVSKCCMKKSDFDKFWTDTAEVLLELAGYVNHDERESMEKKIDQVKTKELIEEEKGQLDKLLKWTFEEKCAEMITQIEQLNQKIAKHDSVPEDISAMKASITSIQEQLNQFGMNSSMEGASDYEAKPVADGGPQTYEVDALKKRVEQMENCILGCMKDMSSGYTAGRLYFMQQIDIQDPPSDNPNALTDGEIKIYSEELGRDWEIFAVYLGYKQVQIDRMKQTYPRQIETLLNNMLKKWHNVVARCDENPKKLLAAAFTGIRDNRTAFRILGNRELVEEVRRMKPKMETEKKIQQIKFESSLTCIGAPFAVNVFPGASFRNSGTISFNPPQHRPIGGSPHTDRAIGGIPHQVPASNICRAEGVGNSMSSNATTQSNLYLRTEDLTLSQTEVSILDQFMKSVGCLVISQLGKDSGRGTVFRVGDRYVITAYHVIKPVEDEMYSQSVPVNTDFSVPVVFVNFNECPTIPSQSIYRLKPPCFRDPNMDIAILEIDNPDSHLPQGLPLCKSDKVLSRVSCITYGHPGSSKKHLDPNCDVLLPNSNKVVSAVKIFRQRVHAISHALNYRGNNLDLVNSAFSGFDDPFGFLLNSFFEHGGSGGPAIDHSRPLSSQVVGIYLQGYPSFFYDLPKEMQISYGADNRFEKCRRTSSLYTALVYHDTELAKNIFG